MVKQRIMLSCTKSNIRPLSMTSWTLHKTFLGPSMAPHPGVDNPLTALGMFSDFSGSDGDGTERASDIDMEE